MIYRLFLWLERWPFDLALLAVRCTVAFYVWRWVQSENGPEGVEFLNATKWLANYGFTLDRAAELITWVGIGLTLSMVTGFATRVVALLLCGMFVWADYVLHPGNNTLNIPLLVLLAVLITRGAGRIAIDYMLLRR